MTASDDSNTNGHGVPRGAEKTVIIGSGPAGWSAAIYAARANLEPLVFEGAITNDNYVNGTLPLGQLSLTTEVENFAGFPAGELGGYLRTALPAEEFDQLVVPPGSHAVTGPQLMFLMRQQARNFGTRIVTDDVVSVDLSRRPFTVTTLEGQTVKAMTIIVATGARAKYLGLESEQRFKNRGVSACAVCDGALPRFRGRPVFVVGGGDSALEEAHYLTKFASQVVLVVRRDALRASMIMQQRAKADPKIEFLWKHEVTEVLGDDASGLTGVKLRNVETGEPSQREAGGLFLAIGHIPNTAFLDGQVEMKSSGYIQWKQPFRTATSVPGVFAAGDVADDYYRQAITSAGTGCMAALDAERYLSEHGVEDIGSDNYSDGPRVEGVKG